MLGKIRSILFPTVTELINKIKSEFTDGAAYLPPQFDTKIPVLLEQELNKVLVTLTRFGTPFLYIGVILPFAFFVLTQTSSQVSQLPIIYVVIAFAFQTIALNLGVRFLDLRSQLLVGYSTGLATFIPLSAALLYYLPHLNFQSALVVIVLLAGASSIIPALIASRRRAFILVICILTPGIIFFLRPYPQMPELWLISPAILLYMSALGWLVQVDNGRRKRGIIRNHFLRSLNLNFNIANSAYSEANEQLQSAYDQENELKTQQDADYFLTASLIQPLSSNQVESDNFAIETFSRAKTKFQFGDTPTELGGDLNIVDHIYIGKRRFLLVMNADAMGKSMQGAGGALVLGTTIRLIISRAKAETEQYSSPDDWLKDAVAELGDVFSQFEGLMLVSLVIGLLDEEDHLFRYINAEHPFCIAYDAHSGARYIEETTTLYKIGSWLNENKQLDILKYQLAPGETMILGSDGRDDLRPVGTSDIDSDPHRLLQLINDCHGDLGLLYSALNQHGKIIDDVSFISIKSNRVPGGSA